MQTKETSFREALGSPGSGYLRPSKLGRQLIYRTQEDNREIRSRYRNKMIWGLKGRSADFSGPMRPTLVVNYNTGRFQ